MKKLLSVIIISALIISCVSMMNFSVCAETYGDVNNDNLIKKKTTLPCANF